MRLRSGKTYSCSFIPCPPPAFAQVPGLPSTCSNSPFFVLTINYDTHFNQHSSPVINEPRASETRAAPSLQEEPPEPLRAGSEGLTPERILQMCNSILRNC